MTQLRQILASNIKKYRALRGFSQMKLAEKIESATNYIAMIETGRKFPSDRILEKIAAALNINAIDLFSSQGTGAALQAELIKNLHEEILSDVTSAIQTRIAAINKKHSQKLP